MTLPPGTTGLSSASAICTKVIADLNTAAQAQNYAKVKSLVEQALKDLQALKPPADRKDAFAAYLKAQEANNQANLAVLDAARAKDAAKVKAGTALSPVLLVRGDIARGFPLQIADGYHRVCASYHLDEDTDIPCRIVGRA